MTDEPTDPQNPVVPEPTSEPTVAMPATPQADAADALGVAICHAQNRAQLALLASNPALNGLSKKGVRIKNGRLVAL